MSTCAARASTNTVESYFSILKRGVIGTYHHVSPQHLKRYVCEFDFRYNELSALGITDAMRFDTAMGVVWSASGSPIGGLVTAPKPPKRGRKGDSA